MPWVKIDEGMPENPKVIGLGPAVKWAHIEAICYCARNLTDGRVPAAAARRMATATGIRQLIEAGLWERDGGGYIVHDYLEYNPSREQVLGERAAARERMANARRSSPDVRPNKTRSSANPSPTPIPTPVPELRESDPPKAPHPDALDVYRELANSLGILGAPQGWAEGWLETRSKAQIVEAIGKAREKGAKSTRYVDAILESDDQPRAPRPARASSTYLKPVANDAYAHLVHTGHPDHCARCAESAAKFDADLAAAGGAE